MAPRLEILGADDKPLPGRFLLTNVHAIDHMLDGEIGNYWPALVVEKSWAPSKVEGGAPSSQREEHLVWLIGKGRL